MRIAELERENTRLKADLIVYKNQADAFRNELRRRFPNDIKIIAIETEFGGTT